MGNLVNPLCCGEDTRPQSIVHYQSNETIFDHCLEQLCTKGGLKPQVATFFKQDFFKKGEIYKTYNNQFLFIYDKTYRFIFLGKFKDIETQNKKVPWGDQCQVSYYDKNKFYIGSFQENLPSRGKFTFDFYNYRRNEPQRHVFQFKGEWSKGKDSTQEWIINSISGKIRIDNSQNIITDVNLTRQMLYNFKYIKYQNQDVYVGQVQKCGQPPKSMAHGIGKYVYRNGYPYYQGEFSHGLRHGSGIMYMNPEKCLQIQWKNGKPHGTGIYVINSINYPVVYQQGRRIENNPSDLQ